MFICENIHSFLIYPTSHPSIHLIGIKHRPAKDHPRCANSISQSACPSFVPYLVFAFENLCQRKLVFRVSSRTTAATTCIHLHHHFFTTFHYRELLLVHKVNSSNVDSYCLFAMSGHQESAVFAVIPASVAGYFPSYSCVVVCILSK